MAKAKNISDETLVIPNVGVVQPGAIIEVPEGFHNANFEKIEEKVVSPKEDKEKK